MQTKLRKSVLLVLSFLLALPTLRAETFEECDGVAEETFVASLTDCQVYIYCDGEDSMTGSCADGEYFNGEICDASENVYCPLDDADYGGDGGDGNDDDEEEEEDTTSSATTVTTPASSTSSPNDDGTSTVETITAPPVVKDQCPLTDDPSQIVLMANSNSCSDYYLCYHGHAIEMHCTNHLHFNAYTGKCDFPENVQCLNDRPNANKCLPHVTDFFPHPENCNYFYYCIKGFMTVQQCPFYYGWDVERRSCVQISQAKCYSSAKRVI